MSASSHSDDLLFGDRWSPITTALTFFQVPLDEAVRSFMSWRGQHVHESTGHPLSTRHVEGDLDTRLSALLPLVSHTPRRYLFLPTTTAGWTAFFDNNWHGADTGSEMTAYATRGITGVTVMSADASTPGGGIRRFQMVWSDETARHGFTGRTIGVQVNDSGRWEMMDSGITLPFEELENYFKRRTADRVTTTMLRSYAGALGLRPYDENFYNRETPGVLIEHTNPPIAGAREFTLAEARLGKPFETIGKQAR